ncbi:MAG: hypothetical protein M3300_10440 [Actinomycetota bacterium]|nr:hypothetical protein [Actinomycetota bacterium]
MAKTCESVGSSSHRLPQMPRPDGVCEKPRQRLYLTGPADSETPLQPYTVGVDLCGNEPRGRGMRLVVGVAHRWGCESPRRQTM